MSFKIISKSRIDTILHPCEVLDLTAWALWAIVLTLYLGGLEHLRSLWPPGEGMVAFKVETLRSWCGATYWCAGDEETPYLMSKSFVVDMMSRWPKEPGDDGEVMRLTTLAFWFVGALYGISNTAIGKRLGDRPRAYLGGAPTLIRVSFWQPTPWDKSPCLQEFAFSILSSLHTTFIAYARILLVWHLPS
jgi:hypothetical protein